MMKITILPIKLTQMPIISEMKTGTVFEFEDGVSALKLSEGQVLLLNYRTGETYLDLAKGYLSVPIKKILGQIVEVVVE